VRYVGCVREGGPNSGWLTASSKVEKRAKPNVSWRRGCVKSGQMMEFWRMEKKFIKYDMSGDYEFVMSGSRQI
jgi:hypothetical protein